MELNEQAKKHPAIAVIGGVLVIYIALRIFGGNSNSSSADSTNAAAYYAAESANAQAGDAVQIAQIQAQAGTAQDLISTSGNVTNNSTWASTDLAETQSNNQAALTIAPIEAQSSVQNNLITTLGTVASIPGTTTTSTSSNSGFLGIGGGSSSTTTYNPDPAATAAGSELANLETLIGSTGTYPAH